MISREFKESPLRQGKDEIIVYTLTTTPWGGSPGNVLVKIYEWDGQATIADKSDTILVGSPSVNGDVVTLPAITGLTPNQTYRIEVKFSVSTQTFEAYGFIRGEE